MIPRRIHFFWAGSLLPPFALASLAGWRATNPDYELVYWNHDNIPQTKQVQLLTQAKRWAALSSIVRAWAISQHGGFYFDTDLELLKSLEPLREFVAFVGTEAYPIFLNDAASGGHAGSDFWRQMLASLESIQTTIAEPELEFGPRNVTRTYLRVSGQPAVTQSMVDQVQVSPQVVALPKRFFFPFNWNEQFKPGCITPDTFGIHHWTKMW